MRTRCHLTHYWGCATGKEPWKDECGHLCRGGTAASSSPSDGREERIYVPWEEAWISAFALWNT